MIKNLRNTMTVTCTKMKRNVVGHRRLFSFQVYTSDHRKSFLRFHGYQKGVHSPTSIQLAGIRETQSIFVAMLNLEHTRCNLRTSSEV